MLTGLGRVHEGHVAAQYSADLRIREAVALMETFLESAPMTQDFRGWQGKHLRLLLQATLHG